MDDNVLMYDRRTESLWSQILRQAVTGPMTDTRLETIPLENTTWEAWKEKHPHTLVLSLKTGHNGPYMRDPYEIRDKRALVVLTDGEVKIYPLEELEDVKKLPLREQIGDRTVFIHFDEKTKNAWATDETGNAIESFTAYAGALNDFFPDSETFQVKK